MEIWKVIPDFNGKYAISNLGRVKNIGTNRVLKPWYDSRGYNRLSFALGKTREIKKAYVHRLVLMTFEVPNPENKPDVNHKNGIPSDNRLENLEWCSRLDNIRHALQTGLSAKLKKHVVLDGQKVKEIRGKYIPGRSGSIGRLSKEYGIKLKHVQKIVYNEIWKHV